MRIKQWRHGAEIVAILAAGVWAFYTFIYEERIKPLSEPGLITVNVTSDVSRSNPAYEFARFHIRFENPGTRTMDVAAESDNVYGAQIIGKRAPAHLGTEWSISPLLSLIDKQLVSSTGYLRAGAAGGPPTHILLRTNEFYTEDITVVVPHGRYAALHMKWQVYIGLAPIRPQYALTVRKSADGSVAIEGKAPNDSGEEYVPL